jgi:beta-glucanase (GH16 family)
VHALQSQATKPVPAHATLQAVRGSSRLTASGAQAGGVTSQSAANATGLKPTVNNQSTASLQKGKLVKSDVPNQPTPAAAPSPSSSYQVNELFEGNSLNTNLWQAMTLPKGYRNHEEQDYLPRQVGVSNGALQITASRDSNGAWHSGEVHSKWHYTYGEFEVRMALTGGGPGVWPAAWLMGATDSWPDNGEIDIMENLNGSSTVYGTIHGGGTSYHWQLQKSLAGLDVSTYHTYKISKSPGLISWWVDGVMRAQWKQSQTPVGNSWPFENHANFALLNLAIGGDWPGPSTAATPSTVTLSIDFFTVKGGY